MNRIMGVVLMLGAAMSLTAATLTVGTAGINPGGSGSVSVTLAGGINVISGVQFDLAYDRNLLTVAIVAGSSATTAQKSVALNDLGTAQRAIIIGGQSQATLNASGQSTFADGVVATLNITVAAGATLGSSTPLTITNVAATSALAAPVTLTGAGGSVNIVSTPPYLVGDVFPYTGDSAGSFGSGTLTANDLIYTLYGVTNAPGLRPPSCSDRFDAMDTFPVDSGGTRGGSGTLTTNDLIYELYYATHAPGFTTVPTRTSRGGCPGQSMQSNVRTSAATRPRRTPEGALVFGAPEPSGSGERVPVYLEARGDLMGVAVSFSVGDEASTLHFTAGDVAPTLTQDSERGFVALAWLEGVNVRSHGRLLLGYVTGPTGLSARLKIFGVSGAGMNDHRDIDFDAPGLNAQDQ